MTEMRGRTNRTPQHAEKFLETLRKGHTVAFCATVAGISLRCAYDWREADPEFKAAWEDAYEHGSHMIEEEARRRAVDGVQEPVFYQGVEVAQVRKFSDGLMLPILRARLDRYKDRQELHHTGNITVTRLIFSAEPTPAIEHEPDDG
jgi:hypothetical protein